MIPPARTGLGAPVRILHLGLGAFFRAHQAWYTAHARDAADWGIAAFTGRTPRAARILQRQDGLYTLVTREPELDRPEIVPVVSAAHDAAEHDAWLAYWRSPDLAVVTITVTEAGYATGPAGVLARGRADVDADTATLRADPAGLVRTAPARLLGGITARHRAGLGPVTLVPCDNLPGNGRVLERVVRELADDTELADAMSAVAFASAVVDRITPATSPEDVRAWGDPAVVVTEPFSEWVIAGTFASGRPRWEDAGARFAPDTTPFERRKLWMLNGAHSLLAYVGEARGHRTVADAVGDPACLERLSAWWDEASAHLDAFAPSDVAAYREALLRRLAHPRLRHPLGQIAADGSRKLPVRVVPVLAAERELGRMPTGAVAVLAGWVRHLRTAASVRDVDAERLARIARGALPQAVPRLLGALSAGLADDTELVAAVLSAAREPV